MKKETASTLLAHSFVAPLYKNEESFGKLRQLFNRHEKMAIKLYELVMCASDNKFMLNGSLYEPCKDVMKFIKQSYDVFGNFFNQDDLMIALKILKTWVEETQSTNVSTFFSVALKAEEVEKAAKDLETIKVDLKYKESSIHLRKLAYALIKSAGFLNFDGFEGKEIKSIIKSVQGSIKSTNTWAESYKHETTKLDQNIELFRKLIKPDIISFMEQLVEKELFVNVNSKNLKTIQILIADNSQSYTVFKNNVKSGWVPSEKIYDYFKNNVSIFENQSTLLTLDENTDEPQEKSIFEYVNLYSKKKNRPEYSSITPFSANDGRTKIALGSNYISVSNMEVVTEANTNYLKVEFKCGENYSLYFTLGAANNTYQTNYQIERINSNIHKLTRNVRRFDTVSKKESLVQMVGILNEPEISIIDGVFKIHLPINWETSKDAENLGIFGNIKTKRSVDYPTTPLAKTFKDKIETLKEVDGTQTVLALDLGWDPMIGIYKNVKMPENSALVEIFKNNKIGEKEYYSFEQYCRDKSHITGNPFYEEMKIFDIDYDVLYKLIAYSKSLMTLLYKIYRKEDVSKNRWALEGFSNYSSTVNSFDSSFFTKKMNKETLLNLLEDIKTFDGDIKSFKTAFIIPIYKFASKIFKAHKDARRTIYANNHQLDMRWLKAVDEFISLIKKTSYIGCSPDGEKINIDHWNEYRDNVEKQFEKEVSCFIRDTALSHGAKLVFVEQLTAEDYVGEDSNQNKARSLFAPSRMKYHILNALTQSNIIMAEVDESMTSKIINESGEFGLRTFKSGWKNIHSVENGEIVSIHADENACDNIFVRGITLGASKIKFNMKTVKNVKKLGNISRLALLMHCVEDIRESSYSDVLDNMEVTANDYENIHNNVILPKIMKDLYNIETKYVYHTKGKFISKETKKLLVDSLAISFERLYGSKNMETARTL